MDILAPQPQRGSEAFTEALSELLRTVNAAVQLASGAQLRHPHDKQRAAAYQLGLWSDVAAAYRELVAVSQVHPAARGEWPG